MKSLHSHNKKGNGMDTRNARNFQTMEATVTELVKAETDLIGTITGNNSNNRETNRKGVC